MTPTPTQVTQLDKSIATIDAIETRRKETIETESEYLASVLPFFPVRKLIGASMTARSDAGAPRGRGENKRSTGSDYNFLADLF